MTTNFKLLGLVLMFIFLTMACNKSKGVEMQFLEGTWKVENKEQYESWQKISSHRIEGEGYKIEDGQKIVMEKLAIITTDTTIIYQATVSNQNDGKTISFVLNPNDKDFYSFENESHDFPKKIKYKIIDENKLFVEVLGNDDQGFSFNLIKQEDLN